MQQEEEPWHALRPLPPPVPPNAPVLLFGLSPFSAGNSDAAPTNTPTPGTPRLLPAPGRVQVTEPGPSHAAASHPAGPQGARWGPAEGGREGGRTVPGGSLPARPCRALPSCPGEQR